MRNTTKVNIYFIIIMILELLMPYILNPIYIVLNISNIALVLVLNHIFIFLIPAMIYLMVTKKSIKQTLRLNKINIKDALFIILIGLLVYPVAIFFSLVTSLIFPNNLAAVMENLITMPFIIILLVVAVTPAITEEITVRGIILSGYRECSRYKSAIITGFIFGMLHLDGQQFLYATVLGFVLAMVVSITNSIFAGCILHFTMNATSLVIQRIVFNVMDVSTVVENNSALTELGVLPIVFLLIFYGLIAILFGSLIWVIIKYIEKKNIRRGIIKEEKFNNSSNDTKVFDLSLIIMIVIYILIMIVSNIIK